MNKISKKKNKIIAFIFINVLTFNVYNVTAGEIIVQKSSDPNKRDIFAEKKEELNKKNIPANNQTYQVNGENYQINEAIVPNYQNQINNNSNIDCYYIRVNFRVSVKKCQNTNQQDYYYFDGENYHSMKPMQKMQSMQQMR